MNAFESVVAMLLRHEGYWVHPNFKVELTKEEKRRIGKHSAPRWEIDVLAFHAERNEVLVVECKSFLNSRGVAFRNGQFAPQETYKLFEFPDLRQVVLMRLATQLQELQMCRPSPTVVLCLAAGHIWTGTDGAEFQRHFDDKGWKLFGPDWIADRLAAAAVSKYENDVLFIVTKLLAERRRKPRESSERANA